MELPSRYTVLETLGEGGMGVVYKARDANLDRLVALKVLRSQYASDDTHRQRFLREAQSAAALRHPHVVRIHEVDFAEDVPYISMEWVEGQTLKVLLENGPLPLPKTLEYARQISDALAAAHSLGIVHRDLKPGNIIITGQNQAKILDFGIAKRTDGLEAGGDQAAAALTTAGVLLGTPAYMSPEQIEGRELDERSDVFSFGALLYEMICGRRAFGAESEIASIWAILRDEPVPLREVTPQIPRELEFLVTLCLHKDREHRVQRMRDITVMLAQIIRSTEEAVSSDRESARLPGATVPSQGRRWLWLAVAGLVLAGLAAVAGALLLPRAAPAAQEYVLRQLTFDDGLSSDPALSPNGLLLAFCSDRAGEGSQDLWLKQVRGGEPIRLTREPVDESQPSFSPDGTQIVFRSERDGGGIFQMPAFGGAPKRITTMGFHPKYSPDGRYIAFWTSPDRYRERFDVGQGEVWIVPAVGGQPRRVAQGLDAAVTPIWSPDGRSLLVGGRQGNVFDTWTVDVETGRVRALGMAGVARQNRLSQVSPPMVWTARNLLVFGAAAGHNLNLWQAAFDPRSGALQPSVRGLTRGPGRHDLATAGAGGPIAFADMEWNNDIWAIPFDPALAIPKGDPVRLTAGPSAQRNPSVNRDGTLLAYMEQRAAATDIFLKNLETGAVTRVTTTGTAGPPVLAQDATLLTFTDGLPDSRHILAGPPSGPFRRIGGSGQAVRLYDVSPRARFLVARGAPNERAIQLIDVRTAESSVILQRPDAILYQGQISPDRNWIAFLVRDENRNDDLYIAPFREVEPVPASEWIRVGPGDKPRWSPDGRMLYFTSQRDGFRCVWVQRFDPAAGRLSGEGFAAIHFHDSRRSLGNVALAELEIEITRDRIFLVLGEVTSNIWILEPAPAQTAGR